jgi:4-amino-4-deoxy-L-arabinose transferase-like glycosyltransferase
MPLYFQMRPIGDNVWFQPSLVYFTALFLTILPVSEWAIRLPSAIVGTIDVVLVYFIAKRLFGAGRPALLAAALLALTPAHFIHSRIAMDYIYPVPFVLGWLLCLMIFLERGNLRLLFLATSLLGLGLYSYIASLIMMPVYLALTCLALALTARRPVQHYLVALAGFAWPLVFMAAWLANHPGTVGDTLSRYGLGAESEPTRAITGLPVSEMLSELRRSARLSSLTGRLTLYWYFFDPSYLFVTGGYANVLNSTRHVGVFLIPLLAAVPVGLWRLAVTKKTALTIIVLLGFATAPLAACLAVPEGYAIDRELELLPFTVLIATFGILHLSSASWRPWRRLGAGLMLAIPFHFAYFLFDYFGDYRLRSAFWFEWNRRGAIEEILLRDQEARVPAVYLSTTHIPYLEAYWRFYLLKYGRPDVVHRSVYYDARTLDIGTVPPGSLVLTARDDKATQAFVAKGALRQVAAIPEPGDPPYFEILIR